MYCKLLNINPDDITTLHLNNNNLTDINGVSIFRNLKVLRLTDNEINYLSSLNNLSKLEYLDISYLYLTDEIQTVNILKSLPKLKTLSCMDTFKTVKIKKELKTKGITIYD